MPRNKALLKKRAGGGGSGSGRGPKKIVIRPFQKPPTLPVNYYRETSRELLEGTVGIAFHCDGSGKPEQQQEERRRNLSLQNSYQQVVNLVSHKYGPDLYRDLVATLRKAVEDHVLPASNLQRGSGGEDFPNLLGYIQGQYQKYVDYLLLCKHVFLPLDRTHAWSPAAGEVVKRSSSAAWPAASAASSSSEGETTTAGPTASTTNASSRSGGGGGAKPAALMDLWQVGLVQFRRRLQDFKWDDLIYRRWWESLQMDWDDTLAGKGPDQVALLQTTLYMWQDLGVLSETLARKLEPDLILFFGRKSEQLKGFGGGGGGGDDYDAVGAITYCQAKWMHVAYNWSRFLPKKTCVKLLEDHLFRPHLKTEWLLHPKNFDPILEKAFSDPSLATGTTMMTTKTRTRPMAGVLSSPSSSSATAPPATTTTTTSYLSNVQQLWMLAGRLAGGYKLVAGAISLYARTRGAALMTFATGGDAIKGGNGKGGGGGVGAAAAAASKIGKQKIGALLELQGRLRQILSHLANSGEHCALKHVWEDVINPASDNLHDETNLVAEALAKYVDACLKDTKRNHSAALLPSSAAVSSSSLVVVGGGKHSDHWAEAVISGIFCYLQAKDTFEAFYKQDLAKRLLWNRVVSMDVERHFVSLLKAECGAGYTSKMEGMFQDMDWSRETMNRYKQTQYEHKDFGGGGTVVAVKSKIEMDMQVLTTGFWPAYPQYPKLILPRSLLEPQNRFTEYYKTKYQGRRMTWQYALGHVVVRFKPRGGASGLTYELVVSLCQALVLLQFNDDDGGVDGTTTTPRELSPRQLMTAVGLEDKAEMERLLLSLSLGKDGTRVLQKRDHDAAKGKKTRMTVHDDDRFRVNAGFRSNTRRIRIYNILAKETKENREKTVKVVSRDRQYLIDAVLVRIMKARKTILHQQLIPQVMEQLKVPAQPSDLKKRIETLIEREYFERDPSDRNRYNYLA